MRSGRGRPGKINGQQMGSCAGNGGTDKARTPSIAFFTRSEVMRPFAARLFTRAALVEPELRQAMLRAPLRATPPRCLKMTWMHNVAMIAMSSRESRSRATVVKVNGFLLMWQSCGAMVGLQAPEARPTPRYSSSGMDVAVLHNANR